MTKTKIKPERYSIMEVRFLNGEEETTLYRIEELYTRGDVDAEVSRRLEEDAKEE